MGPIFYILLFIWILPLPYCLYLDLIRESSHKFPQVFFYGGGLMSIYLTLFVSDQILCGPGRCGFPSWLSPRLGLLLIGCGSLYRGYRYTKSEQEENKLWKQDD